MRDVWRWAAVVVLSCVGVARAHAEDRVHFAWSAPDGACPPASQLVAETEEALGPRTGENGPAVGVDAIVTPRAQGGFGITLVMHFASGDAVRSIEAADCASLVHAAALIVALAMQPDTSPVDGGAAPSPLVDAGVSPPFVDAGQPIDAAEPVSVEPTPTLVEARARLALEAFAVGLLDVGTLPNVAPGFAVGPGLRYDDFHLELLFVALPDGVGTVPGDATRGGRFHLYAGRLAAALDLFHAELWRGGALALAPTVAVEVGDLSGSGFGIGLPANADVPSILAAIGARTTITVGPVVLRLDVEAFASPVQRGFAIGGAHLYTPLPVGLRVGLGVGLHFP